MDRGTRLATLFVGVATVLYIAVFCGLSFQKFVSFGYHDWDLATYSQLAYKSLRFDFSPIIADINYYGNHLHFLLFLFYPLYGLLPSPYTLLALQSLALGLAAIPLFLIARREAGPGIAAGLATAYLLHPALHYANLNDYHPETFLPLLFLWAVYFMLIGRTAWFLAACLACILLKENFGLIVMMLGVYAALRHRMRVGWPLALFGLAWFLAALMIVMPWFAGGRVGYSGVYWELGSDLPSLVKTLILHPLIALGVAFQTHKLVYLSWLLLPLGLLPFLGWRVLWLTLPMFAQHFLASRRSESQLQYYYTIEILPTLLIAAVYGAQWLRDRLGPRTGAILAVGLPAASLACSLVVGPFAPGMNREATLTTLTYDYMDVEKARIVGRVPDKGPAVASFQFLPMLANRKELYSFHYVHTGVRTANTVRQIPFALPDSVEYMLVDVADRWIFRGYYRPDAYTKFAACVRDGGFKVEDFVETFVLFRKGPPTEKFILRDTPSGKIMPPESIICATVADAIYLVACDIRPTERPDVLELHCFWSSLHATTLDINAHFDLVDTSGRLLMTKFHPVGYRLRPTQSWAEGDAIEEVIRLVLPTPDSGIAYELRMGFTEAVTELPCKVEALNPPDALGRVALSLP